MGPSNLSYRRLLPSTVFSLRQVDALCRARAQLEASLREAESRAAAAEQAARQLSASPPTTATAAASSAQGQPLQDQSHAALAAQVGIHWQIEPPHPPPLRSFFVGIDWLCEVENSSYLLAQHHASPAHEH